MNKDNPDPMRYRAVFTLIETKTGVYEVSYGHCNQILAEVGKTYKAGDILYTAGNFGTVYAGGGLVTKEQKLAGSHAGTHLHCPQVRPVKKVLNRDSKKTYLYDGHGLLKKDGFYFEVIDYENGYNGCINPAQFFNTFQAKDAQKVLSIYQKIIDLLTSFLRAKSG